jgi:putative phosphonate metabolism protein
MTRSYHRYAIYAAPRGDSPLGRFGNAWLGRDPETHEPVPRPMVPGYTPEDIAEITKSPSRYGFHGTLVAPFTLAKNLSQEAFLTAVARLGEDLLPVSIPAFDIRTIGSFVAIVPEVSNEALSALAAACVQRMAPYRKPLDEVELERRRSDGLTPNQDRLLTKWGYPYVMEEFRFHMTLTDRLQAPLRKQVQSDLSNYASTILGPHTFDELCVFAEPAPGAPFQLIERFEMGQRHLVAQTG